MIAFAFDRNDVLRWLLSAATVFALHAAGLTFVAVHRQLVAGFEAPDAVLVDLTPSVPSPLQQQFQPPPEPQPKAEEQPQTDTVLPVPKADAVLQSEPLKQEVKPKEDEVAVQETTAPAPPRPSAAQISSWHRQIVLQIERSKIYPPAARARHESGVVQLAFSIDRQGKVTATRIVDSSGSPLLDKETIATVQRAQPFPVPPSNMPGDTFEFTVPVRFSIR